MLILSLVGWWYGQGWLTAWQKLRDSLSKLWQFFSVSQLLGTLFKPWRQIVARSNPNATPGQRLRMVLDNLISRLVGLSVRLLTLLAASLSLAVSGLLGMVGLIGWGLLPLVILWAAAKGFKLL